MGVAAVKVPAVDTLTPVDGAAPKAALTAQVNVRMDAALKQAGDAGLAEVGLSPSDAVRALWGVMAQRGEARERLVEALGCGSGSQGSPERARRLRLVEDMASRYERLRGDGADPHALPPLSPNDWDELAWEDYAASREEVAHG